jgi:alkane 1-monooxygenase
MTTTSIPLSPWTDSKRHLWLLGLLVPALPLVGWGLAIAMDIKQPLLWWLSPMLFYAGISLLDALIGTDASNPPESMVKSLEDDRYYRWCTFLFLPLQYASLIAGAWLITRGGLPTADMLGIAISVGLVNGIGIANAHELGHKKEAVERWLARIVLAPTCYGHFYVEHNRGHHVRVSTPEDPASARLGESFWAFLPRTVIGSAKSAWHLEKERLARSGKGPWTLQNEVLGAWLMSVALFTGMILVFGAAVIPYLLLQAVFGFSLLEVVNYVEHYGLLRQKNADGRYERCQPSHSWNSNHVVTNLLLYHLQRHSDHHANPTRRYQALRHFEESPQLPSGYASMIVTAYFPPLWRWLMDKRVVAHYHGDVARANIHPPARARLLARFGAAANA